MKKSYKYIIETIVICTILIAAYILLQPTDVVQTQRIYPGSKINIANYEFEFTLMTDRVWGAGYGPLRVLFDFITHADFQEDNNFTFALNSFIVTQVDDEWKEGVEVNTYYNNYRYVIGRIGGPLWDCGSQLTVIADITCDLDHNIIFHVEEESSVYCWG